MIIFEKTKKYNNMTVFVFKNENDKAVEIPLDNNISRFILKHLEPLNSSNAKPFDLQDE